MKVIVSSCILGKYCRYNGSNAINPSVIEWLKDHEAVSLCPEVLAGLGTPRPSAELNNGRVKEVTGDDVTELYQKGVQLAMSDINESEIDLAILQSRSPTCGVNQIYNGNFDGQLIEGQGIFAQYLISKGIRVIDVADFDRMILKHHLE
ncbi:MULTISPECIES: DUF523 domain-containing protein [unclassified Enterococcus]|uniref:DUF523 domain-containing protein n=1 Tax=unclassified Enterococcus TaxID=2608891 RepID=UPI001555E3DE|nr:MULTISPECIES: DUF523 domain-containing protein [unclassified Enterococcus]MBS7576321.1 DUF523 domain-containing protein [Enterococcus sp. MMGLQ5-2]MBS7583554.1 DUF523 domain-containing protein [Enterococcus sp. MMGLQ5-1]NPD11416.1 DUF523 domain-containing protein [Enterococcus sp. MMGLQ5-1]NPD36159.1 DUF523 domain-containing protein [Enterococcus sp. MMGLQ5-2]